MSEEVDAHVLRKYDIVQRLGKGAYGIVWRAIDRRSKETVALKKIFDGFQNSTDAQRTFREIMFLQEMSGHEHVVTLLDVLKADNDKDIYLVFEFLETDLHAAIRANVLQDVHKRYIVYQTLKALKYMHSAELLHRDMKPANLLLNADCHMKVADFGLARSLREVQLAAADADAPVLTDYVATRWYRPPEILLGSTRYTYGVDMWSVGCILAELLSGKPAFPGASTINQLEKIVELTGIPDAAALAALRSDYAASMVAELDCPAPLRRAELWAERFPGAPDDAMDLMQRCLSFDSSKRPTAVEALEHPYVAMFRDPPGERVADRTVQMVIDDNTKKGTALYRERLYHEITKMKRRAREQRGAENRPP